jgi:hypothetical protein
MQKKKSSILQRLKKSLRANRRTDKQKVKILYEDMTLHKITGSAIVPLQPNISLYRHT